MRRIAFTLLLLVLTAYTTWAQEPQEVESQISYKPQLFGAVKAKMEVSLYDGEYRFNVRNSRIGLKGFASRNMRYAVQIDFNNQGSISVLDSYVAYAYKNFELSIGQQQYKFNTELDRGPNTNMFANRSFLAKYLTSYYNPSSDYDVMTIGSRDIGALASYKFNSMVPVKINLGAFNGSGVNSPVWSNNVNVVARVDVGAEDGWGGAVSHYNGRTPQVSRLDRVGSLDYDVPYFQDLVMWGGELRYYNDEFHLEAQYAQRRLKNLDKLDLMNLGVVQGYYKFTLAKSAFADYICPLARWDIGNDIPYNNDLNAPHTLLQSFSANRATIGINFGFVTKLFVSEIRLNFEKYLFGDRPLDINANKMFQDKFTLEIVATF